jgi:hypothetical protein
LIFALFGIAVTSIGIFPVNRAQGDRTVSETKEISRIKSFTLFKVIFLGTLVSVIDVFLVQNILLIILTCSLMWVPFSVWMIRESHKPLRLNDITNADQD